MRTFAVVCLLCLSLAVCSSVSLAHGYAMDESLRNPASLVDLGDTSLLYGWYGTDASVLIGYAEYDEIAKGHGALFVRRDNALGTTYSYLAARDFGRASLGMSIHKNTGGSDDWYSDIGVRVNLGLLELGGMVMGMNPSGLNTSITWITASAGSPASFRLGVDAAVTGTPEYRAHLHYSGIRNITLGTVVELDADLSVLSSEHRLMISLSSTTVSISHTLESGLDPVFRIGFGVRY